MRPFASSSIAALPCLSLHDARDMDDIDPAFQPIQRPAPTNGPARSTASCRPRRGLTIDRQPKRANARQNCANRKQPDGERPRLTSQPSRPRSCATRPSASWRSWRREFLPREDGDLPGDIDDGFGRLRRRKTVGFIWCCWIGIGIAVGRQRPRGPPPPARRAQGCLERVCGLRPRG